MISNINGISTSNISNLSVQNQLLAELNSQQTQMNLLETEISTGNQFQLPSQNPQAAMQVEGIQSLLERTNQVQTNISTNQGYLSQTDSTLSTVSNLLTSIQSAALSVVGATASDTQRQAVAQQISSAVQQMVALGNTQFNGRSLFGGMDTGTQPFSINSTGNIVYSGSNDPTESYVNLNQLAATSITGSQAFGAVSQPVEGAALTVALSPSTPLSTLNGGQGVASGSIAISDGHTTSVINLTGAQNLGDVATLIEQNPPAGRTVDVNVTPTGLTLQLEPDPSVYPTGDNLSVHEVNGGTTAANLGILNNTGVGQLPLNGQPLNAAVTEITSLSDLFGAQAQANIHFGQPNSDIVLQANTPGIQTSSGIPLNGVTVQFVADAPQAGQESATYTGAPGTAGTLTVHISTSSTSASRASQIVAAINSVPGLPFTASLDPSDQNGGGQPPLTALPATTTTAGGTGSTLDPAGLLVTSDGNTYTVPVSGDNTVQDLLNGINNSGAGLDATINPAQNGINVSSRVSGATFSIGENGGQTATQLGLRTFTRTTQLSQLNFGNGVGVSTGQPPGGTDFTISETVPGASSNPVTVPVSIAGLTNIGQVVDAINTAAQSAGAGFTAQLATSGNGIVLSDANSANGPIVITADLKSTAAIDLGLVPAGQTSATSSSASGTAVLTGSDTSMQQTDSVFTALLNLGTALRNNNSTGMQQAMSLLTSSTQNLTNTRGELGFQEQSLSSLTTQVSTEQTNLQSAMSNDYSTDMASTVANYTSAQIAYQATLQMTADTMRMTLLNYL